MSSITRLKLGMVPDSPFQDEPPHDAGRPEFSPLLEAEYQRTWLTNSRTLLRASSVLVVLVMLLRALEQGVREPQNAAFLIDYGVVIAASVFVALIAWSPLFERFYRSWARIVVPLRGAAAAVPIVYAAAHGHVEVLMSLPVMLFGAFFFFGLRFTAAVAAGALIILSFVVSAVCAHLDLIIALRSGSFLLAVVLACAAAARHLERWSRTTFLEERRIADLAQHDALTGTKNRRVFDEHLVRLWQQAIEDDRAIAILLFDVDHFKAYNDRYGHLAGDQTLRRIAQTVQRYIRRPLDILARYGGEEFAVILYDMEIGQVRYLADRICRAVAELAIEHGDSSTGAAVTISAGVAALRPSTERNPRGAVQLADQALYEAKLRGRNRIHVMEEADHKAMVTGVFAGPFREANR